MNVLVIAPHPDDESIGCGGALCLHAERGDRVWAAFLTSGELGLKHLQPDEARNIREKEAEAAAQVLGIAGLSFLRQADWFVGDMVNEAADALRPVLKREQPQIVYLPHEAEWHPDHAASLAVLRAALRGSGAQPPELRLYEVWTPLQQYSHVEVIDSVMERKLRAVRLYKSQLRGFRYDRAVRGLGAYRGALAAKSRFAEVFGEASLLESDPLTSGEER
jgi:LmbE family N-acetylglucosaminyl deacetylase